MDRLTLPLELGKRYVRRNGRAVTARILWTGGVMRFDEGSDARVETGLVPRDDASRLHPHDLVSDYVEPATKAHPHAASMLLYAQDAAETDKPWKRWQARRHGFNEWTSMDRGPSWVSDFEYRRTPKTIRIGEFDVPEPLRVAPAGGTPYWLPAFLGPSNGRTVRQFWAGQEQQMIWLAQGLIHSTHEAAELHAEALLSLSAP